jgi:hypothetical protein
VLVFPLSTEVNMALTDIAIKSSGLLPVPLTPP